MLLQSAHVGRERGILDQDIVLVLEVEAAAPELGTAAFVEGLNKAHAWDVRGRSETLPDAGGLLRARDADCA